MNISDNLCATFEWKFFLILSSSLGFQQTFFYVNTKFVVKNVKIFLLQHLKEKIIENSIMKNALPKEMDILIKCNKYC